MKNLKEGKLTLKWFMTKQEEHLYSGRHGQDMKGVAPIVYVFRFTWSMYFARMHISPLNVTWLAWTSNQYFLTNLFVVPFLRHHIHPNTRSWWPIVCCKFKLTKLALRLLQFNRPSGELFWSSTQGKSKREVWQCSFRSWWVPRHKWDTGMHFCFAII